MPLSSLTFLLVSRIIATVAAPQLPPLVLASLFFSSFALYTLLESKSLPFLPHLSRLPHLPPLLDSSSAAAAKPAGPWSAAQLKTLALIGGRFVCLALALHFLGTARTFLVVNCVPVVLVSALGGAASSSAWLALAAWTVAAFVHPGLVPSSFAGWIAGVAAATFAALLLHPPLPSKPALTMYLALASGCFLGSFLLPPALSWSPTTLLGLAPLVLVSTPYLLLPTPSSAQGSTASSGGGSGKPAPINKRATQHVILFAPFCVFPQLDLTALLVATPLLVGALHLQRRSKLDLPLDHHHHPSAAGGGAGPSAAARQRQSLVKALTATRDSKRIFYFLLLTLSFMLVELAVGLLTGSLGLVSDAGHMFFDSASLFIGLYASYAATWRRDAQYTYGYARYETIAGFVNALFLAFVAFLVFFESVERLFNPPEVRTSGLLLTSVLGFCINMVGVVFFHDLQGGGGSHHHQHGHSHNANMHGVYLHVLADTLGSVGVIVSSLLIQWKGWWVADPACSFVISVLILGSVVPLLRSTFASLMLETPPELAGAFARVLDQARARPEVRDVARAHLWRCSKDLVVASVKIELRPGSSEALADELGGVLRRDLEQVCGGGCDGHDGEGDAGRAEVAVEVVVVGTAG
jgi:zinc transporter 5/7